MDRQSLPPVAEAADRARSWARSTASKHHPKLADLCELVASRLVANAVQCTPEDGLIVVTIAPVDGGLRVEVRDPGEAVTVDERDVWSEVLELTPWCGCSRARDGHVTWAELRGPAV